MSKKTTSTPRRAKGFVDGNFVLRKRHRDWLKATGNGSKWIRDRVDEAMAEDDAKERKRA